MAYLMPRNAFSKGARRRGSGTTVPKKARLAPGTRTAPGLQALRHEEEAFLSGCEGQTKASKKLSLST